MARTITQIHNAILNDIAASDVLSTQLTSTSKYAVFRVFTFIFASAIFVFETFLDSHYAEIDTKLANQKALTKPWYRTMALRFQYGDGFSLDTDQDYYDNTNKDAAEVEASKIIKYAAVTDGDEKGVVVVKVAGETNQELAPISDEQKQSLIAYFEEIKGAGTYVNIINFLPDRLYLNIEIYRDPLVLDSSGNSINKGGNPVEKAIMEYMKELPFNGELILQNLVDKLQEVEGVKIVNILEASSSWIDTDLQDYGAPTLINVKRIPVSGYYKVVNFESITYVV